MVNHVENAILTTNAAISKLRYKTGYQYWSLLSIRDSLIKALPEDAPLRVRYEQLKARVQLDQLNTDTPW